MNTKKFLVVLFDAKVDGLLQVNFSEYGKKEQPLAMVLSASTSLFLPFVSSDSLIIPSSPAIKGLTVASSEAYFSLLLPFWEALHQYFPVASVHCE